MTTSQDFTRMQFELSGALQEQRLTFLIEGVLLVVLGLAAMVMPALASLAITVLLGWTFLVSGVAGLALTIWARRLPGFWWSLASAFLSTIVGIFLLIAPIEGTHSLVLVVGTYFLAEGVACIMYSLAHRRELTDRWSWMLVSGMMDILVAAIIVIGLPETAAWALGLLVGINLLFGGATLIGMALAAYTGKL
jgi:uncharacterized membrane protein HdeD (DUF308 family)